MKHSTWIILIVASLMTGCITGLDVGHSSEQITTKRAEFMLSFDDGPIPETEQVLDILATLKAIDGTPVKAGFFLLANSPEEFWQQRFYYAPYELWIDKGSISKYPKIARRIKLAGHSIGNHTTNHTWFRWTWLDTPGAVQGEFTEWEAISKRVLGSSNMHLFRPPYLILNTSVRETAERLGYQIVMGELAGDAVPNMTVDEIMQKTQSILSAWKRPYPCLLIFHDNRPTTYQHLDEIVSNLQHQGFQLVHFDAKRL